MIHAFLLFPTYDLLEDRPIVYITIDNILFFIL